MVVGSQSASVTIRDLSALESALAQPQATFEGQALYPSLSGQAGALCFSLVTNHPFLDGNKRTAHAAMETFPVLNGEVPLGRLAAAREDALFAAYPGSSAADCFVGQMFPVCSGWVAR